MADKKKTKEDERKKAGMGRRPSFAEMLESDELQDIPEKEWKPDMREPNLTPEEKEAALQKAADQRIIDARREVEVNKPTDADKAFLAKIRSSDNKEEPGLFQRIKNFFSSGDGEAPAAKPDAAADSHKYLDDGREWKPETGEAQINREYQPPKSETKQKSLTDRVKDSTKNAKPLDLDPPAPPKKDDPDTVQDDDLEQELLDAKDLYKRAKTQLEKREAIEAIANGLGRIGAGLAGRASGTDMSNVKFDKQDWDRKREAEAGDFRTSLADIGERRRQQIQDQQFQKKFKQDEDQFTKSMGQRDKEFGVTSALSRDTLKETTRHNKAMESVYGAKAIADAQKSGAKVSAGQKKEVEAISNEIYSISKDLEAEKVDEGLAMQRIQGLLVNRLNVDPAAAKQLVVDEGFFSDSIRDPAEIQSGLNDLIAVKSQVVTVEDAEGNQYRLPASQLDAAKAKGYKEVK
jgi:hypothetical protein